LKNLVIENSSVLNDPLTRGFPLRRCKLEGVILANGWNVVPPQYHDETLVRVELFLRDERRTEISVEFEVRVDRSLKRKYEREQTRRRQEARLTRGGGRLYEPEAGPVGDQHIASPEESIKPRHATGGGAALLKPN
jgi:hypothetical protein